MEKLCTFCGHSKIYNSADAIKNQLIETVWRLIEVEHFNYFLIGNYGAFDRMAATVCLEAKRKYPDIAVSLVLPYYRPHIDEYDKAWYQRFDSVITPELEKTPHQYRIIKANQYMVDSADVVIAYVTSQIGGAAKTLEYAHRKKKRIIRLGGDSENSVS